MKQITSLLFLWTLVACVTIPLSAQVAVTGELKKWHKVTLTFNGPSAAEGGNPNPFRNYRLNVTFTKGTKSYLVPGYFAADGNAAESGATSGNKWRVHFCPDEIGVWNYTVSFRSGTDVAMNDSATAGTPVAPNGVTGTLNIQPTDKSGVDMRARGRLQYVNKRYFQFVETGEYF